MSTDMNSLSNSDSNSSPISTSSDEMDEILDSSSASLDELWEFMYDVDDLDLSDDDQDGVLLDRCLRRIPWDGTILATALGTDATKRSKLD